MNFKEIVNSRYATKSFDSEVVPGEKIDELIELIRHAATSFNLQPWVVRIVRDGETKAKLQPASWNQPQITTCSDLFVFCANTDLESLADRLDAQMRESGVPEESIEGFMGMVRPFVGGLHGNARLSWAQRQTYIALANGINGAKSLGLDSCPMEGFDPGQYAEFLGLPDHLVPTVLMPVGYANDSARGKLRFSREHLFQEAGD